MNRYRIVAFLCGLLLAVHFISAQQYMWVWNAGGKLTGMDIADVDHITFSSDSGWFVIANEEMDSVGDHSLTSACNVSLGTCINSIPDSLEIGICYSARNAVPTIDDTCEKLGTLLKDYLFTLSDLDGGTTYYYRIYVRLLNEIFYGDVCQATTTGTKPLAVNGHKFMDLALPSGLLWATCNIGAEALTDDGDYFAWGETTPKDSYSWSTYKYGTSSTNLTKYNKADGKLILEAEDDAATANWGSPCRMPTLEEYKELLDTSNCICTWVEKTSSAGNTISGYMVVSKRNGKYIFLPAAGYQRYGSINEHGSYGIYGSSSLYASLAYNVYCLEFRRSAASCSNENYRYYGRPVRPVAEP